MSTSMHGGRLAASRLRAHGVSHLFTLSGGHLFSLYDGARSEGLALIDVRHEQTAAFAAEGWAKVTRQPGVCALTAGPGVTNGLSAMGGALSNRSPMVVIGGRAPAVRWGQGSLQEVDHLPFVAPLTRLAQTADGPGDIQPALDRAFAAAQGPPGGPAFLDVALDHVFMEAEPSGPAPALAAEVRVDAGELERAAELLRGAERPVVMAGTDLFWAGAERQLVALAEALHVPVFTNGQARGCIPADHQLAFSRTRSRALKEADVALVVGVPMDFRLGFGGAFGDETQIITLQRAPFDAKPPRSADLVLIGDIAAALGELAAAGLQPASGAAVRVQELREAETQARAAQVADFTSGQQPIHPMRIYGDLVDVLGRDAIVICDGGDFASYAGQAVDRYEPGTWLDPGPFGCLGAGPGYALAAKLAHPEREVVILYGDGAFGFSAIEFDTLARHGVHVVGVMGNNGIWALEKHPMEFLYGYAVAADLTPETRYDQMVEALGGTGHLVRDADQLRPTLEQALAPQDGPVLVNVLTDPDTKYPRKANLG